MNNLAKFKKKGFIKKIKPVPEEVYRILIDALKKGLDFTTVCIKHNIKATDYYQISENWLAQRIRKRSAKDYEKSKKRIVEVLLQKYRHKLYYRYNSMEKLEILSMIKSLGGGVRKHLKLLGLPSSTFYKWRKRFESKGIKGLEPIIKTSQKKYKQDKYVKAVFSILHSPPSEFGINRTTWKMDDIYIKMKEKGFPISMHYIKTIIKEAGYRFKKAKKVLTSNDPNYKQKLKTITTILSNLKSNEKFFSIDEYGPFTVKIRGGRRLVGKGERPTYPQFQKSKGWLIMTAALELSTNQVTHFYSKKKDTEEMIKLLDILINNYKKEACLYLSWDAASWHISKKLKERVVELNQVKDSPKIVLAPLPARAQFLNVIESVFSGMSRAIIHNSNYKTVDECKNAIDRYFNERNQHFQSNPKRAGKKIWGKERVACIFKEENNCKDPKYLR